MRIVSLLPSATEFLFALGLGPEIVGVTHECDFPPEAAEIPDLTHGTLDEDVLSEFEPDLIVSHQFPTDGAIGFDDMRAIAERLPSLPEVVALDPATVGEALGCIRTIAQAVDDRRVLLGERAVDFDTPGEIKDAGVDLLRSLADRIDALKLDLRHLGPDELPSVVALESLDPPTVTGRWIPQMIELAGGIDLLGMSGELPQQTDWDQLRTVSPDTLILMQSGYDLARCNAEADDFAGELRSVGASRLLACDASAFFSRPGPRLVDGLEQLAHALHPSLTPEPESGRMIEVEPA